MLNREVLLTPNRVIPRVIRVGKAGSLRPRPDHLAEVPLEAPVEPRQQGPQQERQECGNLIAFINDSPPTNQK